MIIGNNNHNNNFNDKSASFNSNFEQRFNTVKEEGMKNQGKISPFNDNTHTGQYKDVLNKNEMADKSFSMLQERLNNGLISLEEFNRKCKALNKLRNK